MAMPALGVVLLTHEVANLDRARACATAFGGRVVTEPGAFPAADGRPCRACIVTAPGGVRLELVEPG
jgi:hypothetical protein